VSRVNAPEVPTAAAPAPDDGWTGPAALGRIVRGLAPTAGALALLLAAAGLWQHWRPVAFPRRYGGVDREVIRAQLDRVETIPTELGVLLVGDSSGLMGIDPEMLQASLGVETESLNTLGYVGPRGYASLLDRFRARGGTASRLVLVLHPSSLMRKPVWLAWERMTISGALDPNPPADLVQGTRARLLSIAEPVLYFPLYGPLGDFYGNAPALGAFIRAHKGAAIEPGGPLGEVALVPGGNDRLEVNETFLETLPALAEAVDRFGPDQTRLVLMPQPDWFAGADLDRQAGEIRTRLERELHLDPARRLETPATMPAALFGTPTHLSPVGRAEFTRLLAERLADDRRRVPFTTATP
jgi:hypothetical protein